MTDDKEIIDIAKRLHLSTQAKKLSWEPYEDEGEYVARTKHFSYYIRPRDSDDAPPYVFQIFRRADNGASMGMVSEYTTVGQSSEYTTAFMALYMAAKLSAFGIGSLKDEIFKDLEG